MPTWIMVLGMMLVGGFIGALGLSLLTHLFYWLFARQALRDGQYLFVFFFTAPFGGMLGVIAGLAFALSRIQQLKIAGWICVVGGGLVALLHGLVAYGSAKSRWGQAEVGLMRALADILSALLSPWAGYAVLWAAMLIAWGIILLRKQ